MKLLSGESLQELLQPVLKCLDQSCSAISFWLMIILQSWIHCNIYISGDYEKQCKGVYNRWILTQFVIRTQVFGETNTHTWMIALIYVKEDFKSSIFIIYYINFVNEFTEPQKQQHKFFLFLQNFPWCIYPK